MKKEDTFTIPDHGEPSWTEGAESFSRQEVFNLLHTQRSMIFNDLSRNLKEGFTREMKAVFDNARRPQF